MLNLIKRVHFPEGLQISGDVVKAALLNHVSTYHDLLNQAHRQAQIILRDANDEAERIKEQSRQLAANSVREDLVSLKKITAWKENNLLDNSSSICTEVCVVVLEKFISTASDFLKIKTLAEALVIRSHNARELNLQANPAQVDLVKKVLAEVLAEQMNLRKCNVKADEELQPFELKISTANGAEINVSLNNLIAMYKEEIERLEPALVPVIKNLEVNSESIS